MNETLIHNWNNVVGEDDTVYHLGDVALGAWVDWDKSLSRLNGHKILVVGNHDRLFQVKEAQRERWIAEYGKWFVAIAPAQRGIRLADGTVVNLSHFPYDGDSHGDDRFASERLSDDGTILVHGHTHSNSVLSQSRLGTPQVHVGADAHDFTPVSEDQVIGYIEMFKNGVQV